MKHYTVTAVGLLLSGCAVQGNSRPDIPADDVVDQMLAVNMQKVSFVQQQLIAALTPVLPASPTTASAAKHPASASADIPVSAPHLPALTYTGQRQAIPALAAPGKAPTLHLALVKIIPDTWSIHFDMGLKPEVKRPLTWVGNDQWPYVLSRILVQEKLRAEVNWSAQKVSVSAAGAAPTTSPVTSATATSATKTASDKPAPAGKNPFTGTGAGADADAGKGAITKPGTVTMAATVTAAMPPPTVWRATPGVTLKDALLDWTTREKCPSGGTWKLAWNTSVSYRIDAPLAFSGSFREALNQLFILYGAASTPLYAATQSAQCVLLVDDKEPR